LSSVFVPTRAPPIFPQFFFGIIFKGQSLPTICRPSFFSGASWRARAGWSWFRNV